MRVPVREISSIGARPAFEHGAGLVFAAMSLGEILIGVVIVVLPRQTVRLLVDAALDARGAIVAQMLGVAVLALGITWGQARAKQIHCTPGFIVYNLGVGSLFGWAALASSQPVLPAIVCAAHLGAGIVVAALVMRKAAS